MHKTNNPQCTIFLYISVKNGALWDMGLVHCEICAMGLLINQKLVFGYQILILRHKKILNREDLYDWYGDLILIHNKQRCIFQQFSAANLDLAGFPLTNALGESMPSRL